MATSEFEVIVVGAGAAGLVAAIRAAERGKRVLLLEKNSRCGTKILMSGGTRCNITQATDARGIVDAFGRQGRFLHSPLAALSPDDVLQLFHAEGVTTKVEAGGKVFPTSDRAADVLAALMKRLRRSGCQLALDEPVNSIGRTGDRFALVTSVRTLQASKVIVTTGGKSYPGSGTTGDGYAWMQALGHTIVPPRPALTPIVSNLEWVRNLKGVTLPQVAATVSEHGNELDRRLGSLLFTHFGLSGPTALNLSRMISGHPQPGSLQLLLDCLPQINESQLREQLSAGKKSVVGVLTEWLPRRLALALLVNATLPPDRRTAELSKAERSRLIEHLKRSSITISGTRGFKKAEVTAGGVQLDEIDSRTMQSKRVPNLFIAGELLDLDGPIGGYNFQAAFSTGWLAASHV